MDDSKRSKGKLSSIPDLLEVQEWDKVRSILKPSPVNKLWKLGDSLNLILNQVKSPSDGDGLEDQEKFWLTICNRVRN